VGAVARVAQTGDPDLSKDGLEGAGTEALVSIQHWLGGLVNAQSGSHLSVAPVLEVCLEQPPLDFTSFGPLLEFDLMEREL